MTNKQSFYFDEKYRVLSCHSYVDFILTLRQLQTKNFIDVDTTLRSTPYNIFHEDGELTSLYRWYNLFPILEGTYGIKHDSSRSFCTNQSFYLYVDESFTLPEVVQDTPVQEEEEESSATLISLDVEEATPEVSESQAIDWEHLETFRDDSKKRKSKDDLEKYCIEHYDINLRKNQSFDDMLDELRSAKGE